MKKIIFASLLLLVGSSAFAQTAACTPGAARVVIPGATGNFIREDFNPVCSANTVMVYTDSAALQKLTGGSASVKGSVYFAGSTLGGAVSKAGDCANKTCGGSEATTKAAAGLTAANALGT